MPHKSLFDGIDVVSNEKMFRVDLALFVIQKWYGSYGKYHLCYSILNVFWRTRT